MDSNELKQQYQLQQWTAMIRDRRAQGVTVKDWCHSQGTSESQYYYRLRAVRHAFPGTPQMLDPGNENTSATMPLENVHKSEMDIVAISAAQSQVAFAPVTDHMIPHDSAASMRISCGRSVIEVSNDVSDRILDMLQKVILHAD